MARKTRHNHHTTHPPSFTCTAVGNMHVHNTRRAVSVGRPGRAAAWGGSVFRNDRAKRAVVPEVGGVN